MTVSSSRATAFSRRTAFKAGVAGLGAAVMTGSPSGSPVLAQSATPTLSVTDRVTQAVDTLDGLITSMMASSGIPGLAVAVVHDDEVLLTAGYGVTSTETNASVDADTMFQLASLSKPIASTVIASIVGDGLVDWDKRLVEHLPDFMLNDGWVTNEVTIRDMLTHRSGLPEHAGDVLEDMGYDREEVLHRLRYQPLTSSFRSLHAYTNFGFTAGAIAASNADGGAWEDVSQARLYDPAGMTRTSSRFADFADDANHAFGHVLENGSWIPKYVRQPDAQSPAGGVSSSARDMAQWLRLQLGNGTLEGVEVAAAEALAETHRPQSFSRPAADPSVDQPGMYGLGWNVHYTAQSGVQLGHSGAFAIGAGTAVYMLPAMNLGIVVLTNATPVGIAESVALSFLDIVNFGEVQADYLPILASVMAESLAPTYGQDIDVDNPPPDPAPSLDVAAYEGLYLNDYYGEVRVVAQADGLTLSQGPNPDVYPLTHWERDTFIYLPTGENANIWSAVTFTIDPGGTVSRVTIENLDILGLGTFIRGTNAD